MYMVVSVIKDEDKTVGFVVIECKFGDAYNLSCEAIEKEIMNGGDFFNIQLQLKGGKRELSGIECDFSEFPSISIKGQTIENKLTVVRSMRDSYVIANSRGEVSTVTSREAHDWARRGLFGNGKYTDSGNSAGIVGKFMTESTEIKRGYNPLKETMNISRY